MATKEKKTISEKTAIKAIITGFVSYGILISFIFAILIILLAYLSNKFTLSTNLFCKILASLAFSFLLYFTIRLICKLSNIDLLRKCKFDKKQEVFACKRLNLFYLLCALFFILLIISSLIVRFNTQLSQIEYNYQSKLIDVSQDDYNLAINYAEDYKKNALNNYYENREITLIISTIIELGLVLSFISLIPYQKELLDIYNK